MTKKILLVYVNYSSFVKTDYEILSENFEVSKYQYKPVRGIFRNAIEFIKQLFYLIFHIQKFQTFYVWFGDYHAFLPVLLGKLFKKKTFVVIGGYDVANLPEFRYGTMTSPLRKLLTTYSFKHATLCLPVVEGLQEQLKKICPLANSKTIYTGYQYNFKGNEYLNKKRKKTILTVSITNNYQRFMIKGLDRFRELALLLPDYKFYVIGVKENTKKLFAPCPTNLHLIPPLQANQLVEYYLDAPYYAQFSRSEGLPNALCEAMLYGCIPLGIQIGGIPTAIGNNGLVLKNWNSKIVVDYITEQSKTVNREKISEYIKSRFNTALRANKLKTLLEIK